MFPLGMIAIWTTYLKCTCVCAVAKAGVRKGVIDRLSKYCSFYHKFQISFFQYK